MADRNLGIEEIRIEDPMDFLSASEKEAYIRAHRNTLMHGEEDMRRIREQTHPVRATGSRRRRNAYAYENAYEDAYDDMEEATQVRASAAEWIVSVAVRAMFAAIVIVGLIIVYMMFLRPVVQRTFGRSKLFSATGENADDVDLEMAMHLGQDVTSGASAPDARETSSGAGEAVVTTTDLRLRTAPSTETGEVITTVPGGTRLSRIADDGSWSTVLYEGQELYCASEYLRKEQE